MNLPKLSPLLKGIVWSNVIGLLLLIVLKAVAEQATGIRGLITSSTFILVPVAIGMISAYFWSEADFHIAKMLTLSLLNTGITLTGASLFAGEGIICLLIIAGFIAALVGIGVLIGWLLFKVFKAVFGKNTTGTMNVSLAALAIVIIILDTTSAHYHERLVADDLVIAAPKEKVWEYVVAFPRIEAAPEFWLFKTGLPYPVQTTVSARSQGAERKCIFSSGVTFDEVMTAFEPNTDLTFEIVGQPEDPEILGHFQLTKGQFLLKDNGDGTTTLTGNSWYQLKVFPAWYYDLWAESIVREVHLRVMNHIKTLAEHAPQAIK